MEYFTTTSKASKRAADCVIIGIYERGKLGVGATDIDAASTGEIRRLIKSGDLSGSLLIEGSALHLQADLTFLDRCEEQYLRSRT